MAQDTLVLYLRLAPEFGGTRFGPFEGSEVRLGSDQTKNDVVLPETLGVAAAHVKVLRQADMGIIIAPVERTAAVYVWQGNANRPKQITTPVAVRTGDSFSLVTAQGPRFIVEMDELPEQIKQQRAEAKRYNPRKRLSAEAFKEEGKRQAWVSVLTTYPGQFGMRAYTFVRSGAIFMPRNIIMLVGIGGGYIFGGAQLCSNFSIKDKLKKNEASLESCNQKVAIADELQNTDSADLKFDALAARITGATALGAALKGDPVLSQLTKEKAKNLFLNCAADCTKYEWLLDPKKGKRRASTFATFREALLDEDDIPADTARVLVYAAAAPDLSQEFWTKSFDSQGQEVCARGPLALSYRQGRQLGLAPMLDAYVRGSSADYDGEGSRQARVDALKGTGTAAGLRGEELDAAVNGESKLIGITASSRDFCVHMDGDDKRNEVPALVKALAKHVGEDSPGLPAGDVNFGVTARVAKLYVADWQGVAFDERKTADLGFDLSKSPPGAALEGPPGTWALDRTAETIARSMVLPCIAVLKYSSEGNLAATFGEELPSPIYCLVLDWKLRNE